MGIHCCQQWLIRLQTHLLLRTALRCMPVTALLLEETSMPLQLPDTLMNWERRPWDLVSGQVDHTFELSYQPRKGKSMAVERSKSVAITAYQRSYEHKRQTANEYQSDQCFEPCCSWPRKMNQKRLQASRYAIGSKTSNSDKDTGLAFGAKL